MLYEVITIVGRNNWLTNWTEFNPNQVDYGEATEILNGNITADTKLVKRNVYLLFVITSYSIHYTKLYDMVLQVKSLIAR